MFEVIGSGARATGVLDFFLAGGHLRQSARRLAARIPEVDLERQGVEMRTAVDDPLQWGVRDQAAIPVVLAFDLHGCEPRRQGCARHDVLRPDRVRRGVEINEISTPY